MPRANLNQPIDGLLLRAIHACARENGCDNEGLHDAIRSGFNKASLKVLTRGEAYRLLDGLRGGRESKHFTPNSGRRKAQGNHGRRDYDAAADAIYPVTEREREMLREAAALRNWDESQLAGFVFRQIKKSAVATMGDFNRVFWPLKSMNRRQGLHRG